MRGLNRYEKTAVLYRTGSLEIGLSTTPKRSPVLCRTGSLEMTGPDFALGVKVLCRTGSLENAVLTSSAR